MGLFDNIFGGGTRDEKSVQSDINKALKDSGGKWTENLNDLVAERDRARSGATTSSSGRRQKPLRAKVFLRQISRTTLHVLTPPLPATQRNKTLGAVIDLMMPPSEHPLVAMYLKTLQPLAERVRVHLSLQKFRLKCAVRHCVSLNRNVVLGRFRIKCSPISRAWGVCLVRDLCRKGVCSDTQCLSSR
jgi:hypothetical protein